MVGGGTNILVIQVTVNDKVFSLAAITPGKQSKHWTGSWVNNITILGKLKIPIPLQRIKHNFSNLQFTSQDGLLWLLAEV